MQSLNVFCDEWVSSYRRAAGNIPIFNQSSPELDRAQRDTFVRLFYHARGHFNRFLWVMASYAPTPRHKAVVLRNIADELGGLQPDDISHEQLFLRFARGFCPFIDEEIRQERDYLPFLREFNDVHYRALMLGGHATRWAMFAAYELLDNVDYENLERLAVSMGAEREELTFFEVHRGSEHFTETFDLLEEIWSERATLVKANFDFIAGHQLAMWTELSRITCLKAE